MFNVRVTCVHARVTCVQCASNMCLMREQHVFNARETRVQCASNMFNAQVTCVQCASNMCRAGQNRI